MYMAVYTGPPTDTYHVVLIWIVGLFVYSSGDQTQGLDTY